MPLRLLAIAVLVFLLHGCARHPGEPLESIPTEETTGRTVTLMTFNVQNLFDAVDDPGKDDRTYLPIEAKRSREHRDACSRIENRRWRDECLNWDWDEGVVERKLVAVADAILQVDDGRGPDIVVLQEVENIRILERLRTVYLERAGYFPAILVEGGDARGIDVAFLSRLEPVGDAVLHPIPFSGFPPERIADTRGILEATFRLPDDTLLTGFAVHFPAPYHPYEMRIEAYTYLARLRSSLPPGRAAFAAGDFNTPADEDRDRRMLARYVRPVWQVGHEAGCRDCRGTYYYRPKEQWSFLDMILWSGGDSGWGLLDGSARLADGTPAQMTAQGYPARFRMPEAEGVSDHLPLVVEIGKR
ncbi:MAG: endonuclease/exonuclease/phosphatase family protein [Gammaproteobacteria bacterium]